MTEAAALAETLDKTRSLTRFYLSHLKDVDPQERLELRGYRLNSIYWICAHLVWAEDNLAIRMTGGESVAPDWASNFRIGSSGELPNDRPAFKTVLDTMKQVHDAAIRHIRGLTSEQLDENNTENFHFGDGDATKRMIIQHCIRHEGTHLGQLSLIAKIYGKKII
ncbi:MAG: DinB family protein [Chitinophagales bacterium]|nr:DinB family protein [Chitinophagales bacterium]